MRTHGPGIVFEEGALVFLLRHWNEDWRIFEPRPQNLWINLDTYYSMILPSSLLSFLLITLKHSDSFGALTRQHNTKIRWDTVSSDFSSKKSQRYIVIVIILDYVVYCKWPLMAVRNALEMVDPRPQPTVHITSIQNEWPKPWSFYLMVWYYPDTGILLYFNMPL